MFANESCDGETQRRRVGDKAILRIEKEPIHAQMRSGAAGLLSAYPWFREVARLAITQIHQERALPLVGQRGERAAHLYFSIVGMRRDDQDIVGHERDSSE